MGRRRPTPPVARPAPEPPDGTAKPWLRHGGWFCALCAMLLYSPSLRYGYTYDDKELVRDNERIRQLSRPAAYLLTGWWQRPDSVSREYRPATLASFALDYHF